MHEFPTHYVHLEVSTKCALKCDRCPRTEMAGMYTIGEMSIDLVQKILDQIKNELKHVVLCGGQGDPIYNSNFIEIVRYIKSLPNTPSIKIITNGSYKTKEWWEELSSVLTPRDIVVFSIDGWDNESNNLYRQGSDFDSIMTGMEVIAKGDAVVRWATILFKFNQDKLEDIRDLAKSVGADYFDITKSSLFGSRFPGYVDDDLGYDPLEPDPEYITNLGSRFDRYNMRLKSDEHYRSKELDVLYDNRRKELFEEKKLAYKDSFIVPICTCSGVLYVDVKGLLYPCSWVSHPWRKKRGIYSKRLIYGDENYWSKHKDDIDLNIHTVYEIFKGKVFSALKSSWSTIDKCFLECENKCLNEHVDYHKIVKTQWRENGK